MKYALFLLLGLLSFAGALAGALALTGNLNGEALQRLLGSPAAEAVNNASAENQDVDMLVRQLREKETALARKEQELKERESQLLLREESLKTLRDEVEQMQSRVQGAMEEADAERKVRIESVALTLTEMRPNKAAERLDGMPPEEVAEILALIEAKDRGKIIEAMDAETATRVLRQLQEKTP